MPYNFLSGCYDYTKKAWKLLTNQISEALDCLTLSDSNSPRPDIAYWRIYNQGRRHIANIFKCRESVQFSEI